MTDPQVLDAAAQVLGDQVPLDDAAIGSYSGTLVVQGARNLAGVERFTSMAGLTLLACDAPDLEFVRNLAALKELRVIACTTTDASAVIACTSLERLDLAFTLLQEIPDLTKVPHLIEVRSTGNGLDEPSERMLRVALPATGRRTAVASPQDLAVSRTLRQHGACFGVFGLRSLLVRPGPPALPNAEVDFTVAPRGLLEMYAARPGFTIDSFFQTMGLGRRPPNAPPHRLDPDEHIAIGTSADAEAWVSAASLPSGFAPLLARFIRGLPALTFYREDGTYTTKAGDAAGANLPQWLFDTRKAVTFVLPYHVGVEARFTDRQEARIYGEPRGAWFVIGLRGIPDHTKRPILDVNRLYPIGANVPDGDRVIAISVDPGDLGIYSFSLEDQTGAGHMEKADILQCASSYAELLSNIAAVRFDGAIVERRNGDQ